MVSNERLLAVSVAVAAVGISVWFLYRRRKSIKATLKVRLFKLNIQIKYECFQRNAYGFITFHDLENKVELKLAKKTIISPNTRLFRFQLLSDGHVPGLRAGEHVVLSAIVSFPREINLCDLFRLMERLLRESTLQFRMTNF
jgi:hypothetical protein